MKALSKPISSSPGRTEKFPPPLMKFLRNNVSSKSSRKRSRRSSPMFIRKKNTTVIETTQEPTSPKVTCIGQVRVRRSSSKSKNSSNSSLKTNVSKKTPFLWVRKALFCHHFFPSSHKPRPSRPFSRKWSLFFCFGYCKKVDTRDGSSRVESIPRELNHVIDNNGDYITSTIVEAQVIEEKSTPPRNALLLTRCRSAPYRSSSLASRFWGSPLKGVEDNEEKSEVEEQICRDEVAETRLSKQIEEKAKSIEDLRGVVCGGAAAVHPLLLTRCKSEPARIGERLNLDASFWKHRRFDVSEPSSLHNGD